MSRTPSKAADLTKLVAVVVAGVLLASVGFWYVSGRGGGSGAVDGQVVYQGEDTYSVQLGPGGWFVHSDDEGGYVMEHADGGRSWQLDSYRRPEAIASDGRSVSVLGGDVTVVGDGTEVEATASDLLVAHGDRSLRPGETGEVVGLSERHVAVTSCLSADGQVGIGDSGGQLLVSGVDLDDGRVSWTHDPEVACDADLATLYPTALPEQRYALLTPSDDRTEAIDLDTGKVAKAWRDAPRGRVVVGGDVAVHRAGDEVTATSLRSGKRIAQVSCAGARLDTPGDSGGRLAPDATPLVRCGDSVRLFDGTDFVAVDAPPVDKSQEVHDGRSVVHDRYLLRRDGERVTITDALSGKEVGSVEVPDGMRISTNEPRGRLIIFFTSRDKRFSDQIYASQRVVDARTATMVATTDDKMAPGAEASADGYAVLSKRTERRRNRPARQYVWVVGVR